MGDSPKNIVPIALHARSAAEKFGKEHDSELLTILFTDLVDSTKVQSESGNVEALRLTELHRKIVRVELANYDAREIEWAGDSCLAVFMKPSDAVAFALRTQAEHRRVRASEPKLPLVRIGMHLGEILVRKGEKKEDLFGLQVSEASRIMSAARGSQIFCTRAVFDSARGALRGTEIEGVGPVAWVNHGLYQLKGSADHAELCEVGEGDSASFRAPLPSDKCRPAGSEFDSPRAQQILSTRTVWLVTGVISLAAFAGGYIARPLLSDTKVFEAKPARMIIQLDTDHPVSTFGGTSFALSPDGSRFVYNSPSDSSGLLYMRSIDELEAHPLPGTENAHAAHFSSDGKWIGYSVDNELKKISLATGATQTLLTDLGDFRDWEWSEDGKIVLAGRSGMTIIDPGSSEPSIFVKTDRDKNEMEYDSPEFIENGRAILYTKVFLGGGRRAELYFPENGSSRVLIENAGATRFIPPGHLVFSRGSDLLAVPFDTAALKTTGNATGIGESVYVEPNWGTTFFDVSSSGALLYVPSTASQTSQIMLIRPDGFSKRLPLPPADYDWPRFSPRGDFLTLSFSLDSSENTQILLWDMTRQVSTQLTRGAQSNFSAIWDPQGEKVMFASYGKGPDTVIRYVKVADPDVITPVLKNTTRNIPGSWSHDGKHVAYVQWHPDNQPDIWVLDATGDGEATPFLDSSGFEEQPRFSPVDYLLAYMSFSTRSEKSQIWLTEFGGLEKESQASKIQVSFEGGRDPAWSGDGKHLYFRNERQVMAVTVQRGAELSVSRPFLVLEIAIIDRGTDVPSFDVSPWERIMAVVQTEGVPFSTTRLLYVPNWINVLEHAENN